MYIHIYRRLIASIFILCIGCANADSPPLPLSTIAETCRQAAMQLDWLSQNQSRKNCSENLGLDSLNVYYASKYILANQLRIASEITSYSCAITEHPIMGVAL